MIQINQKYFYDIIDLERNDIRVATKIPHITQEKVHEFKIGKNFFYKIKDDNKLISIQKKLNLFLLNNIPINGVAVAFRNGYSYLNLFEPHRENYFFLRLDIRSFFHSINIDSIKEAFKIYFAMNDEKAAECLENFLKITSYTVPNDSPNKKFSNKTILPMGFATSPVISNIVFRQIDIQIQRYCSDKHIVYTRYADDMLFSSTKMKSSFIHSDHFINEIRIIISQIGLKLNTKKTLKSEHTLSLNGYVIQGKIKNIELEIRISKKKTQIIKKLIHLHEKKMPAKEILRKLFRYKIDPTAFRSPIAEKTITKYYNDQLKNKLSGYRSYLISIIIFNKRYKCTGTATIKKYSEIIDKLNTIISIL